MLQTEILGVEHTNGRFRSVDLRVFKTINYVKGPFLNPVKSLLAGSAAVTM